jgi:hypothetical protein
MLRGDQFCPIANIQRQLRSLTEVAMWRSRMDTWVSESYIASLLACHMLHCPPATATCSFSTRYPALVSGTTSELASMECCFAFASTVRTICIAWQNYSCRSIRYRTIQTTFGACLNMATSIEGNPPVHAPPGPSSQRPKGA